MTDNLYLTAFHSEHAHHMVTSMMNDPHTEIDANYRDLLNNLEVPEMSFTSMCQDKIVCSGGIIPVWDGVFEGWVMASNLIWKHRISGARIIKKGMDELIEEYNVVRLQTAVKKDFTLGHRFAEWLGMKQEGLMKKYQNNEDYFRYARVM